MVITWKFSTERQRAKQACKLTEQVQRWSSIPQLSSGQTSSPATFQVCFHKRLSFISYIGGSKKSSVLTSNKMLEAFKDILSYNFELGL